MIGVETEDDVWKLFWNGKPPKDGHEKPGQKVVSFNALRAVLQKARLTDTSRRYYLFHCDIIPETWDGAPPPMTEAVVPQSRLLKVGRAMVSRDRDVLVQYLGTAPESARSNAKTT